MNYPSGRIMFLRENKEAPAIPEVSALFLFHLLLCSVTDTTALGGTCFMASKRKQLSLSCSVMRLHFPLLHLAALVSLIL